MSWFLLFLEVFGAWCFGAFLLGGVWCAVVVFAARRNLRRDVARVRAEVDRVLGGVS